MMIAISAYKGKLSGNTEVCNQIWPSFPQLTKLGLERKNSKSSVAVYYLMEWHKVDHAHG
eukprot:1149753-Pelagomonas_calceolata.AAC.9